MLKSLYLIKKFCFLVKRFLTYSIQRTEIMPKNLIVWHKYLVLQLLVRIQDKMSKLLIMHSPYQPTVPFRSLSPSFSFLPILFPPVSKIPPLLPSYLSLCNLQLCFSFCITFDCFPITQECPILEIWLELPHDLSLPFFSHHTNLWTASAPPVSP